MSIIAPEESDGEPQKNYALGESETDESEESSSQATNSDMDRSWTEPSNSEEEETEAETDDEMILEQSNQLKDAIVCPDNPTGPEDNLSRFLAKIGDEPFHLAYDEYNTEAIKKAWPHLKSKNVTVLDLATIDQVKPTEVKNLLYVATDDHDFGAISALDDVSSVMNVPSYHVVLDETRQSLLLQMMAESLVELYVLDNRMDVD